MRARSLRRGHPPSLGDGGEVAATPVPEVMAPMPFDAASDAPARFRPSPKGSEGASKVPSGGRPDPRLSRLSNSWIIPPEGERWADTAGTGVGGAPDLRAPGGPLR